MSSHTFSFTNEFNLKRHVKRHSGAEVKCPLCDKVSSKIGLANHIRYVHEERRHKCNICGKCFARPLGLKVRVKIFFRIILTLLCSYILVFVGAYGFSYGTGSVQLPVLCKNI